MANEGEIKLQYPVSGLGTITAKVFMPDDTIRPGQGAVVLDDIGHDNLYTNAGTADIVAGDNILFYLAGVNITSEEYQPDVTVINVNDCKADVSALATEANASTNKNTIVTEIDANETKIDALQADVTLIKTETDLLDGMIIEDSGGNRFTVVALGNAPTPGADNITNIDHQTDLEVQDASPALVRGIIARDSDPTLDTTNVDRNTEAELDTGTSDDHIIQPGVLVDRESDPSVQGD